MILKAVQGYFNQRKVRFGLTADRQCTCNSSSSITNYLAKICLIDEYKKTERIYFFHLIANNLLRVGTHIGIHDLVEKNIKTFHVAFNYFTDDIAVELLTDYKSSLQPVEFFEPVSFQNRNLLLQKIQNSKQ